MNAMNEILVTENFQFKERRLNVDIGFRFLTYLHKLNVRSGEIQDKQQEDRVTTFSQKLYQSLNKGTKAIILKLLTKDT